MIVIDASVALKCLLPEDGSDEAEALVAAEISVAPDLIVSECLNALWKNARRNLIGRDEAVMAAALLDRLGFRLTSSSTLAARALDIALALDHAVYDCFYLALAETAGAEFVTMDKTLARKVSGNDAVRARVRLLKGSL